MNCTLVGCIVHYGYIFGSLYKTEDYYDTSTADEGALSLEAPLHYR